MNKYFSIAIFLSALLIADTVQAFSISPLKFTTTVAAGDSQDWEVKVVNNSDHVSVFSPMVIGMKQDSIGRSIFGKNIDIAESWFKTQSGDVRLAPGESFNEIFSVNVPINTPPGAHYIGLAIQEKSGQSLSGQLATVLNLQISGTAQESLILEKFLINKEIFFNKNWLAQIQLRNNGNVSLNLDAKEDLFYFGKKISQKSFNLGSVIFSQSIRNVEINLSNVDKFIFPGFYRSNIKIVYGVTHQVINKEVGFWYLPVWFLTVLSVIILSLIFFVFKKKRNVVV